MKMHAEEEDETGDDIREHAAAELSHMFDGIDGDGDSDNGDDDSDDNVEEEEEVEYEGESGEDDHNGDTHGNSSETNKEVLSDNANNSKKFVFDASDQDFSKYGEFEEENESGEKDSENEDDAENLDGSDDLEDENGSDVETGVLNNTSVSGEVGKGKAVTHQLKTWDKLLEARIQQQKILSKVNRLPVDEYWNKLVAASETDLTAVMKETQTTLKALLNDLHHLETALTQGPDCEPPAKKKKLAEFGTIFEESHLSYKAERNDIIQKWNDKTKLTGGKNSFASLETSTVSQIEQILSNSSRLIERTRIKRTHYTALGRDNNIEESLTETDLNIFDDGDFYHQLLRDLIDRKTSSSADGSQLTRQWLEVQKLRSKLKKKVDTKASKGRKIRYDIHTRMVNFMAPVYTHSNREQSTNQLFSSLFGTRKA